MVSVDLVIIGMLTSLILGIISGIRLMADQYHPYNSRSSYGSSRRDRRD